MIEIKKSIALLARYSRDIAEIVLEGLGSLTEFELNICVRKMGTVEHDTGLNSYGVETKALKMLGRSNLVHSFSAFRIKDFMSL